MSQDKLEAALKAARWYRDLGNTILVVGIFAEILIEAVWPDAKGSQDGSFASRFSKWWKDHFWKGKNIAILLAGVVTLSGLWLERTQGTSADDLADQIRTNLESQTARLSEIGPRDLSLDQQKALVETWRKYAGQTITLIGHDDPDSGPLAYRLLELLRQAGLIVKQAAWRPNEQYGGVFVISGDPKDAPMLDTISCSLMRDGIFSMSEPLWWGDICTAKNANDPFCIRRIVVGGKPPFFTSDQIRTMPCRPIGNR
jgi:hypothetical protein